MSVDKQSAPLPRDQDTASFSEMLPFRSKKINLWKSPIVWFVVLAAIITVVLFGTLNGVLGGNDTQAKVDGFLLLVKGTLFYMMALSLFAVHAYAKSDKPIFFYLFPIVLVYLIMNSPVWNVIYPIFDALAGGSIEDPNLSLPVAVWRAFAGPGLREEFTKCIPAFICAAMTVWPERFKFLPPKIYNLMRVRSPLDGVLMGFAAGSAFLFSETSGQYVQGAVLNFLKENPGNIMGGFGAGIMLLLPRAMDGWIGHMAWSGIFGYFVGLAVIRPHARWKLLGMGWLIAAVLHGAWDSPSGGILKLVIGGASGLMAVACLIKARQLDASVFGRMPETFGSIVVGAPNAPMPAMAAAGYVAAPAPMPRYVAPAPAAPKPVAPASVAPAALAPSGLSLNIGELHLPLHNGATFDLGAEPSLAGRANGLRLEVTQHPTNPKVLGLKNLGTGTWYARLRDNTLQSVEPQRNLRLAPGGSIDFGNGIVAQIVQS